MIDSSKLRQLRPDPPNNIHSGHGSLLLKGGRFIFHVLVLLAMHLCHSHCQVQDLSMPLSQRSRSSSAELRRDTCQLLGELPVCTPIPNLGCVSVCTTVPLPPPSLSLSFSPGQLASPAGHLSLSLSASLCLHNSGYVTIVEMLLGSSS